MGLVICSPRLLQLAAILREMYKMAQHMMVMQWGDPPMKYWRLAVPHQSEPLTAAGLRLMPDHSKTPPQPQAARGTPHGMFRPLDVFACHCLFIAHNWEVGYPGVLRLILIYFVNHFLFHLFSYVYLSLTWITGKKLIFCFTIEGYCESKWISLSLSHVLWFE